MKKVLILIFILCSYSVYSQPVISVGMTNDNLLDLPGLPLDSLFGGADDRYSYSFFTDIADNNWKILFDFQAVTYRADGARYDCISLVYNYKLNREVFTITAGGGFEVIGDFRSSVLQNGLHSLTDIPEVELEYLPYEIGLVLQFCADFNYLKLVDERLLFYTEAELDLNTTLSPEVLAIGFPVVFKYSFFSAEICSGVNIKYDARNSWLSGSSLFVRTVLGFSLPGNIILNIGTSRNFFFFNPFSDTFIQYDWRTQGFDEDLSVLEIPAFYFCLSFGSENIRTRDIPLP